MSCEISRKKYHDKISKDFLKFYYVISIRLYYRANQSLNQYLEAYVCICIYISSHVQTLYLIRNQNYRIYANYIIVKCQDLTLDNINILRVMPSETIPKHSTNSSDQFSTRIFCQLIGNVEEVSYMQNISLHDHRHT